MKILKNPLFILFFIVLGILCGLSFEGKHIEIVGKLGDLYINMIQATVIPILISAIISSVARLIHEKAIEKTFKRIVLTFVGALVVVLSITIIVAFIVNPGVLTLSEQIGINKIIKDADTNIDLAIKIHSHEVIEHTNPFFAFLIQLVSSNVFHSLAHGNILEIVFFCFVLGIALGKITTRDSRLILSFISELFHSVQIIISWILYILPFGLFMIVTKQVSSFGLDALGSVLKFLLSFFYITAILVVLNTVVVWKRSELSFREVIGAIFEIIILPMTTRNSFACIPVAIETLTEKLYFNRLTSNLLIPLGVTVVRFGNIVYFCLASIFIAQIYGVELSFQELLLLPIASIVAGIATAGASGFVTLQALSIVTIPLGLPIEAIMIILYLIDPIVDPFRTLLIVNTNFSLVAIISDVYQPRKEQYQNTDEEEELDVTKAVMAQLQDNSQEES